MEPQPFWTIEELKAAYENRTCTVKAVVNASWSVINEWEPLLNAFISMDPGGDVEGDRDGPESDRDATLEGREGSKTDWDDVESDLPDMAQAGWEGAEGDLPDMETAHRPAHQHSPRTDLQTSGLLRGVPIALKDLVDVAECRTTSGSRIRKGFVPDKDAVVWARLQRQGAILMGKTNMLEFAYGVPHPDYGQTNNPYHPMRTSGGSSGGSAAAVAVGGVYAAIGTDTGGSIRIPAAYCGVVGLKPTYGRVSVDGVFPLSSSLDHVGPITRTPRDAAFVMEAIADKPEFMAAMETQSDMRRIGYLADADLPYTHSDMRAAYKNALETLQNLGVQLVALTAAQIKVMQDTESILMTILLAEAAEAHRQWWNRGDDYAPLTWQQIEQGRGVLAVDYLHALTQQREMRGIINGWFDDLDALVTPTVDFPAPIEDPAIGDVEMNEMRYTGPFNLSGNPALTVPCGMSREGLPLGLQFVGALYEDARLLRLAHEFSTAHGEIPHPDISLVARFKTLDSSHGVES
ncbi:amidase [Alicyclobacillus curvatus]|nr:amidase [Alicyclobacillus curvatus]